MTEPERVARELLRICERFAPASEIEALLADDVVRIEHPNVLVPKGRVQRRDEVLRGFELGRNLLASQRYDIEHATTSGSTVALEIAWRGELAVQAGPWSAGTVLEARVAMFVEVREGRITQLRHYDCYLPVAPHPSR